MTKLKAKSILQKLSLYFYIFNLYHLSKFLENGDFNELKLNNQNLNSEITFYLNLITLLK